MLNPVGARFNPQTMRMELTSFAEVLFNPVAQSKFVHTVSAGYVTGAMFVMSIGAYYMLRGRHVGVARRSIAVAASFGLASALSVVVLGDESGYTTGLNQKMKIAAIEAMWETEPAPASFTLFGLPDVATETTKYGVKIPWVLGLIATRSLDEPVEGIMPLVAKAEERIRAGLPAYAWLEKEGGGPTAEVPAELECVDRRPGLRVPSKTHPARHRKRDRRANSRSRAVDNPRCSRAVLVLPDHGGAGVLLYRACLAPISIW